MQNDRAIMSSRFASLILATSLVGCAADGGDPTGPAGAGGKADGEVPVLAFANDWTETQTGELLAGSPVRIEYDLDRLQDCRSSTNGSEVWAVTGYASFDGGEPVVVELSRIDTSGVVRPVAPELEIPATATTLEMWFSVHDRWGCIAYDSNENANYTFEVTRGELGPVIAFAGDWTESVSAPLTAGDRAIVHYDPARLSQCAASSSGNAAWSVTMHYRIDGGEVKTMLVSRADGPDLVAADPTLTIPRGDALELWFSATNVYGCNAYDSNLGGNYHFAID